MSRFVEHLGKAPEGSSEGAARAFLRFNTQSIGGQVAESVRAFSAQAMGGQVAESVRAFSAQAMGAQVAESITAFNTQRFGAQVTEAIKLFNADLIIGTSLAEMVESIALEDDGGAISDPSEVQALVATTIACVLYLLLGQRVARASVGVMADVVQQAVLVLRAAAAIEEQSRDVAGLLAIFTAGGLVTAVWRHLSRAVNSDQSGTTGVDQ